MNSNDRKRSLIRDCLTCAQNKKQRVVLNDLSQTSSTTSINRLENLSNEVFYEIFEYLDGFDLLNAFSNLNLRFETLVHHSSISLKVTYNGYKTTSMKDFCRKTILTNKDRLLSLNSMFDWQGDVCIGCSVFNESFERLESLTLVSLTVNQLAINCLYLQSLPCLYSLRVYLTTGDSSSKFDMMYREILSLPVLKYCAIFSTHGCEDPETTFVRQLVMKQKSSSIEALYIHHPISVCIVLSLLTCLPKIRHLKCHFITESDTNNHKMEKIKLQYLKQLSIEQYRMAFNRFEVFMHSIGEKIEILRLEMAERVEYLNGDRWEQMIRNDLPQLKVFDLKFPNISEKDIPSIYNSISPFYSQFWIERRWFPSVIFGPHWMTFHIHPYRKKWFDQHRQIELDWISSKSPSYQTSLPEINQASSSFNQVKFMFPVGQDLRLIWFGNIKDFISRVPFTELIIERWESWSLIRDMIGNPMIHLDTIILGFILTADNNPLCIFREKKRTQLPWASQNQITKVKIESIINAEDLEYVMNSFSKMEYLEVKIKSNRFDVTTALQYILTNQSMKAPHLRSICFDGVKMDRDVLDHLRQVIDGEPYIRNYHLNCVKNRIFIQWNRCE